MIIKRLFQYIALFLFLTTTGLFAFWGVSYLVDKSIESTLKRYETTRNADEVRKILLEYHGEAEDQQVSYSFVGWGLIHQKDFIEIVEGIEPNEKPRLLARIAWGIVDSVQVDAFENAFKDYDSQVIKDIKAEIQKIKF